MHELKELRNTRTDGVELYTKMELGNGTVHETTRNAGVHGMKQNM
jgi:hypothetical protein